MINETHNFDPLIAKKYNVNVSIVYYTLMNWINYKNKIKSGKHKGSDGKYYYFASASSSVMQKQMPYLSKTSIKNALKILTDEEILISGTYNKVSWDKTRWYANKAKEIIDNRNNLLT